MENTNNNNCLIVNISKDIKNQIDSNFQHLYSQKNIDKIYFIVDRINRKKDGKERINIRDYSALLGLKSGEITNIISILNNIKIIKKTGEYKKGICSNQYSIINSYTINNSIQIHFNPEKMVLPKWVEKYISIYDIPKASTTKGLNKNKMENPQENLKNINIQQAERIIALEAELATLRTLLSSTNHLPVPVEIVSEIEANEVINGKYDESIFEEDDDMAELDNLFFPKKDEIVTDENLENDTKFFPKTADYPEMTIVNYSLIARLTGDVNEIKEEINDANTGEGNLWSLGLLINKKEDWKDFSVTATLSVA